MEDIVHEVEVREPAERAYAAAATQAGIRGWWSSRADVGEREGAPVTLRFPYEGNDVIMRFEVSALEPGRRVLWTCTDNVNPVWPGSTIEWTFTRQGSGSKVRLVHSGFSGGGPPYETTVEGWKPFVASLQQYVNTGEGLPAS